jgi:hypothetical protein
MNAEMDTRYGGIFAREYNNFAEARLWELADSSYALDIRQFANSTNAFPLNAPSMLTERVRIPLTLLQVVELRTRISMAVMNAPQFTLFGPVYMPMGTEMELSQWERTNLALSVGLTGLTYGIVSDVSSGSNAGTFRLFGPYSLLTPIVYGGGTLYAAHQPWFTRASSTMLTSGITLGVLHGFGLYGLAASTLQPQTSTIDGLFPTALGFGALEAAAGIYAADRFGWTYGESAMITSVATSGLLLGAGLPFVAGGYDNAGSSGAQLGIGAALALSTAGYWGGYALAQTQYFTGGDANIAAFPASVGLFIPLSIGFLTPPVDWKLTVGTAIAGHVCGYALGLWLVGNKDFSLDQYRTVNQFAGFGGLLGLIPITLARSGSAFASFPLISFIGSAIGFGIGYAISAPQAALADKARRAVLLDSTGKSSSLLRIEEGYDDVASNSTWFSRLLERTNMEVSPLGILSVGTFGRGAGMLQNLFSTGIALPIMSIRTQLEENEVQRQQEQVEMLHGEMLERNPRRYLDGGGKLFDGEE